MGGSDIYYATMTRGGNRIWDLGFGIWLEEQRGVGISVLTTDIP